MSFLTSTFYRRLLLVLLPFTALVVYGYSALIVSSMKTAENRTIQEYLRSEYLLFERRYAETGSEELPSSDILKAWWDDDQDVPETFAALDPGIHALPKSQHLLVAEPRGAGRRAYFVLREPGPSSNQMIRSEMESTIYIAAVFVLLSGGLLAVMIARLLSRPLRALANDVRTGRPDAGVLYGRDRNDEIGTLSRAMGDLIGRMDSALVRERSVTRFASHDMRTPVSVIRVALSVLALPDCDEEVRSRTLQRIDQACADIEDRIEVHLCLARESAELSSESIDLHAMVEDEIEKHGHVVQAKKLKITIEGSCDDVRTSRAMLRIVLSNLLQNAVNYSSHTIDVNLAAHQIEIRNSTECTPDHQGEYGIGLEIVQRVCSRMDWEYAACSEEGAYSAKLVFPDEPNNQHGERL